MIGQPVPLFGSPFADAKGNVWLLSYRPVYPEEGSPYTVISPDGTAQGPAQVQLVRHLERNMADKPSG